MGPISKKYCYEISECVMRLSCQKANNGNPSIDIVEVKDRGKTQTKFC